MRKRSLSDTAAIAARVPARTRSDEGEHHSVSVRKIDNGYITTECHQKGSHFETRERFTADKPQLDYDEQNPSPDTGLGLRHAIEVAKGRA